MELGIARRTAAVAAGSAGLGLGLAKALAADGVRVAICGRDPDRLAEAAAEIEGEVLTITSDLSNPDEGRSFVEQAIAGLGSVDILVTNAGGPPPGMFESTKIAAATGLGRESLYKSLSPNGNPELATVLKVMRATGLRLHASLADDAAAA